MDLSEAKRLIQGGENKQVEFKTKINHPEKVIREIVAFANTEGGHLFVGVDDDKTIPGVKHGEEEDYILRKAIMQLCRPRIIFEFHMFRLTEKRALLHYYILPGLKRPYYVFRKKYHRFGKAFVRVADRSVQASPEIRKILEFNNNPKDVHFGFGSNEKLLFSYLQEHEQITIKEFCEISGLNYRTASSTMVRLVKANVLNIIPREIEDWYVAIEQKIA